MLLEVTVEKSPVPETAWVIELAGELDFHSAPRFRSSFGLASPPAGGAIVLDLTRLDFLDSAGLAAIVALYLQLDDADVHLAVVSDSRQVARMFSVTDVQRFLPVSPTRAHALASLRGGPVR